MPDEAPDRRVAAHGQRLGQELEAVAEEETDEHIEGKAIFSNKWLLRILLVGIGISMSQQLTGINSNMYYGSGS